MGSPQQPTAEQYEQLEKAGKLAENNTPPTLIVEDSRATLKLRLPRQAVSLVQLTF